LVRKIEQEKKQKTSTQTGRPERRIYVLDIKADSIMTSGSGVRAYIIKGKKEAEYICRQLERKYGKKFYMEETVNFLKK
jgi:hypothetical protein